MESDVPLLRTRTKVAFFQLGKHKTTHIHLSHEFQNLLCSAVQTIFHVNLLHQILNLIRYTENIIRILYGFCVSFSPKTTLNCSNFCLSLTLI